MMFIGALFMAILFGWVAHALERANITKMRFREHMQVVNEDMGFRGLEPELRARVARRYTRQGPLSYSVLAALLPLPFVHTTLLSLGRVCFTCDTCTTRLSPWRVCFTVLHL